jgi:UbiD family decarboxylase
MDNILWTVGEACVMILENYIKKLSKENKIERFDKKISRSLEIAGVLKALEPTPAIFEEVKESEFRVAGNLFCTKEQIADYFGIKKEDIIPTDTSS